MNTAKVFKNGRSQAVRLPKECRISDNEVFVNKIGDVVMLIPKDSGWSIMESATEYFTKDFMESRNQPNAQKRDELL